jgi:predicted nuclease of predicted toxin-antitoxin system
MRFLADMGVSLGVCAWLRQEGHDVVHLRDEGLQRLPNGEIFLKAVKEDRIVLTFDLDFGEIVSNAGTDTAGVVVFRLKNTRTERVIERLGTVLRQSQDALDDRAIIVVEEGRHRIRRPPLPGQDSVDP